MRIRLHGEFDELLVNTVEKYPCLYDVIKLREFKDNKLKANAWLRIADELGTGSIGAFQPFQT